MQGSINLERSHQGPPALCHWKCEKTQQKAEKCSRQERIPRQKIMNKKQSISVLSATANMLPQTVVGGRGEIPGRDPGKILSVTNNRMRFPIFVEQNY